MDEVPVLYKPPKERPNWYGPDGIGFLDLPVFVKESLWAAHITTVALLARVPNGDLLVMPGIGRKMVKLIRAEVAKHTTGSAVQ